MGLWLLQECRRTWTNRGEERSYAELIQMAEQAEPFKAVIDPDNAEFFKPGDMPAVSTTSVTVLDRLTRKAKPKSSAVCWKAWH